MIKNLRLKAILGNFKIEDHTFDYEDFIARFFNMCLDEGMEHGKIVPSRAFCSDESQGFPTILITKHFSAFPFDHGLVGGIMAKGRNAAHAHHGKDLVILQASHVGYDDDSHSFGRYRRLQTTNCHHSSNCGKIFATLKWYRREYIFAADNTMLHRDGDDCFITIDKQLYDQSYEEGLFLHLDKMVKMREDGTKPRPLEILSTSRVLPASKELVRFVTEEGFRWVDGTPMRLGKFLRPELFTFNLNELSGESMEANLHEYMPWIVTSN